MRRFALTIAAVFGAALLAGGTAVADGDDEPEVYSTTAQNVAATTAVLRAYVDPNGRPTTYVFEYGTTTSYGSQTTQASAGASDDWKLVTMAATGLEPSTTYHFRAVATNSEGTTYGADRTFTTPAAAGGGGGEVPAEPGGTPVPGGDGSVDDSDSDSRVAVGTTEGVVRVRKPGSSEFVELDGDAELPEGSEVDARKGAVALTSVLPSGATQTGEFGGGRFVIRRGRRGYVDLHMRGPVCPRKPAANQSQSRVGAVAAGRPRAGRRLWGRDRGGRFRTRGKNSHATVRGTRWVVADRCDGTLTRVTEGAVVVRDLVRGRRKLLEAGERYLARPRR
jgi:hypothetical protein